MSKIISNQLQDYYFIAFQGQTAPRRYCCSRRTPASRSPTTTDGFGASRTSYREPTRGSARRRPTRWSEWLDRWCATVVPVKGPVRYSNPQTTRDWTPNGTGNYENGTWSFTIVNYWSSTAVVCASPGVFQKLRGPFKIIDLFGRFDTIYLYYTKYFIFDF